MSRRLRHCPTIVLLVALLGLLALWAPAAASAEGSAYGELTRFGEGSSGERTGLLNDEELVFPKTEYTEEMRFHLLGVEQSTNDVYVLDEPENFSQRTIEVECDPEEEEEYPEPCLEGVGPMTRHFRIQKFDPGANGEYHAVASVKFEEKSNPGPEGGQGLNVEGIAVDPGSTVDHRPKRIYVLVDDVRQKKDSIDRSGSEGNLSVASTLFAFSTENGELTPAGKEETVDKKKVTGPILTSETELAAQSDEKGKALLEPHGITVDPATGDVIILAHEDLAGEETDRIRNPGDHYVLQRISPSGKVMTEAEGGRYVDTAGFFKTGRFDPSPPPSSPVVVGPEQDEQVDVDYESGIARVPYEFSSTQAPEYVHPPSEPPKGVFEGFLPYARLGGGLTASPSSEGSVLYTQAPVENELPNVGGEQQGLVSFSSSGSVLGWTGGQSLTAPRRVQPPEPSYACVISPEDDEAPLQIAAGSEGRVFVLATGFIERELHAPVYTGQPYPAVVELGPHGIGCPEATAEPITAEVNGQLLGSGSVSMSQQVAFSSFVLQGDVSKVEWNFGDGTTETVEGQFHCPQSAPKQYREKLQQCPSVHHIFVKPGDLEVTEKIYTDDLSTPTLTRTTTVSVSGGAQPPMAVATGPVEVTKGQQALFDGSASWDPQGANQIKEYHWNFGDGHEESTTKPTVQHLYASTGFYTVSLTVTDDHGLTSKPDTLPDPVAVVEPKAPGEEIMAPLQSGTGASSSRQAVVATSPPTPTPSPSPAPDVTVSSTSLTVNVKGQLPIVLNCPAGAPSCSGTVTLRALVAGAVRHGKRSKATEVTLATGSFALAGGGHKRISVRLSAQALALLAHEHLLHAQLTILARGSTGVTRATRIPVLVRAAASAARKR